MPADTDLLARADEANASPDDPRVAAALQEYQTLLDAGLRPDRDEFLSRYTDVAAVLAEAMDGLDFVCEAVNTRAGQAPAGNGRPVPAQLGDFRIVREVGRGGMGVVYEAEQI